MSKRSLIVAGAALAALLLAGCASGSGIPGPTTLPSPNSGPNCGNVAVQALHGPSQAFTQNRADQAETNKVIVFCLLDGTGLYTRQQSAAITGALAPEANYDPEAEGPGNSFGIAMWTGAKRSQLENFAFGQNLDPANITVQAAFLQRDLESAGSPELGSLKTYIQDQTNDNTVETVVDAMVKFYLVNESGNDPQRDVRIAAAESLLS